MTIAVDMGRKATKTTKKNSKICPNISNISDLFERLCILFHYSMGTSKVRAIRLNVDPCRRTGEVKVFSKISFTLAAGTVTDSSVSIMNV